MYFGLKELHYAKKAKTDKTTDIYLHQLLVSCVEKKFSFILKAHSFR